MAERPPITCHVLDTTTGRPGPSISVALSLQNSTNSAPSFTGTTNSDGRIVSWNHSDPSTNTTSVNETIKSLIKDHGAKDAGKVPKGSSVWKLEFDTGSYYGPEKCFFPKVELTFLVKEGEHFHVPLLLGPYSFTTYRGS